LTLVIIKGLKMRLDLSRVQRVKEN